MTGEAHPTARRELARQPFQRTTRRAIADHGQSRRGVRSCELREGADEEMDPLALDQAADEQQVATARVRGTEAADIDAVGMTSITAPGSLRSARRRSSRLTATMRADRCQTRRATCRMSSGSSRRSLGL
jgi:hypothetical protein